MRIPQNVKHIIQDLSQSAANDCIETIRSNIESALEERSSNTEYRVLYDTTVKLVRNKYGQHLYDSVKRTVEKHTKSLCQIIVQQRDEAFLQKLLQVWEKFRKNISGIRDYLMYLDDFFVNKNFEQYTALSQAALNTQYSSTNSTSTNSPLSSSPISSSFQQNTLQIPSFGSNPISIRTLQQYIKTVYDLSVYSFKNEVLLNVTQRMQRLINEIIRKERDSSEVSDRFMLKHLTQMMVEVDKEGVYIEMFENDLIKETAEYYRREASFLFDISSAVSYLTRVRERLLQEVDRSSRCFDHDTRPKIEAAVKKEMIEAYKELVVKKEGSGVYIMLQNQKTDDLKLVYDVLSQVKGALEPTIEVVREFAKREGEKIAKDKKKDETNPLSIVTEMIDLRVYYDDLLYKSFSHESHGLRVRDKDFSKAIKDAFDHTVNENERFPEYLSLLLDAKLTKGNNQIEDDKSDTFFDRVIMIFRHVREKDVFEKYYKNHLSRRLLSGKSNDDDDEKQFLSKLKSEFGYQITSKLEGMFKDIRISNDLMKEWDNFCTTNASFKPAFELNVQVLTHVYWPIPSTAPNAAKLQFQEPEISSACDSFAHFYTLQHSGRKLTWQYNMGTADVVCNAFDRKYEFMVTTYQMAILMLFNRKLTLDESSNPAVASSVEDGSNKIVYTYDEIANLTKIPITELKRNLSALLLPVSKEKESRILVKLGSTSSTEADASQSSNSKKTVSIEKDSKFILNEDFKSSKTKNTVKSVVSKKQTTEEVAETTEKVSEERKWAIDATIVRIMKMRKKLEHRNLVNEVMEQLHSRFPATSQLIKSRIESLIEREYLERSESDRMMYHYLA